LENTKNEINVEREFEDFGILTEPKFVPVPLKIQDFHPLVEY